MRNTAGKGMGKDEYVLIASTFFNLLRLPFIFSFLLVPLPFFFLLSSFFRDLYSFFPPQLRPSLFSLSSNSSHSLRRLHALRHYVLSSSFFFILISYSPLFVRRSSSLLYYYLPFFLPFIFPVSRDHLSPNFSFSPSPCYLDKTSFFFLSYNFPPLLFYLSSLLLS